MDLSNSQSLLYYRERERERGGRERERETVLTEYYRERERGKEAGRQAETERSEQLNVQPLTRCHSLLEVSDYCDYEIVIYRYAAVVTKASPQIKYVGPRPVRKLSHSQTVRFAQLAYQFIFNR